MAALSSRTNRHGMKNAIRKIALSHRLTSRESEMVGAVALGLSNKEIAERYAIAEQTVKDHLSRVYLKVGVHQRTALLARMFAVSGDGNDAA